MKRTADLATLIGVHALHDQLIILEDGSVGIGYAVHDFEDESLDQSGYAHFIQTLRRTLEKLPAETMLQKIDTYYQVPFVGPCSQGNTVFQAEQAHYYSCLLYTSPSPRDA